MTRRSNRGGDGRTTNPSGPLIVKVSTARGCIERRSIESGRAQRARVIKLPFYIRILSRPARGATLCSHSPSSFHLLYLLSVPSLSALAISFFLDFIDSIYPRCGLFSPYPRNFLLPSSLSLCLAPGRRPAVANSPRCAARAASSAFRSICGRVGRTFAIQLYRQRSLLGSNAERLKINPGCDRFNGGTHHVPRPL